MIIVLSDVHLGYYCTDVGQFKDFLRKIAVCIVRLGYSISVAEIYSSVRADALGHSATY